METRIYENGVLQGAAVKQSSGGEVEERQYVEGKLNGKATVIYTDTSKEMRTYKVKTLSLYYNYCHWREVLNLRSKPSLYSVFMAFLDRIKKQNIKISTDIMMYDIIEKN